MSDTLVELVTTFIPAGIALVRSLGQESGLSIQRKNEETRRCSELFILLARKIHLKYVISIEEL